MLTGDLISTLMVALFLALFGVAFVWAWYHRQLQDIERVKFELFEDDDEPITR